jgi:hypothetical protein
MAAWRRPTAACGTLWLLPATTDADDQKAISALGDRIDRLEP